MHRAIALQQAIKEIQDDMVLQVQMFEVEKKHLEAKRLKERTEFDLEMMRELGYCSGIENYSRYFDRRKPGSRPFCLLDYFPDDYLLVVDESHVTLPQVRAMWGGDRSRKVNLVDYGFRLPSAMDNRPLTFNEFEGLVNQAIYVSATPSEYELRKSEGVVVEQIIRPTGLLDPHIDVRPSKNQIDDLFEEIDERSGAALARKYVGRALLSADFWNRGREDLLMTNLDGSPVLLRNEAPAVGRWLKIKTVGTKSNRDGFGARIEITADGSMRYGEVRAGSSFESSSDPRLHFGLGSATRVDGILVRWPSGQVDKFGPESSDQELVVEEGRGVVERKTSSKAKR